MDIIQILSEELEISKKQIESTIALIDEGNTIPFIARYRKEVTGGLDDTVLRKLGKRLEYLRNLAEKKEDVIRIITEQGKMTDEILASIEKASTMQEMEDIYRPFRPKRRTRATVAKEKGLEPLAQIILMQLESKKSLPELASEYITEEVPTLEDALAGARDIIAESVSDDADKRKSVREFTYKNGIVVSKGAKEEESVYSGYYEFSESVNKIANHRILAINRGEKEDFLSVKIEVDEEAVVRNLKNGIVIGEGEMSAQVALAVEDSYERLIAPSIEREIRNLLTERAQEKSIELFSKNLKQLLLAPPISGKNVLGLDPGYRTGCKVAVVDFTGKVLDTDVIYCTLDHHDKDKAKKTVINLINKHNVDIVAIGNGTASKESEIFVAGLLPEVDRDVKYIMVSEAGASVYSASEVGAAEFPDYDVALRSAVSIARRLEDPLAELVKIDPKSIGVGQYQHDMNQKNLESALGGVVEDCVNSVGVDVNTASPHLLSYVAGINSAVAANIVAYREENGVFTDRKQFKKVSKLGDKAFLQCAGFMRIPGGKMVLDNTAVHPESYGKCRNQRNDCRNCKEYIKQWSVK